MKHFTARKKKIVLLCEFSAHKKSALLISGTGNFKIYLPERSSNTARVLAQGILGHFCVQVPCHTAGLYLILLFVSWHLRVNSILGGFTHLQKGKHACVQHWDNIVQVSVPEISLIT